MFLRFIALFILIPLAEFMVLVKVGNAIGLFPTLLMALGTAVLGAFLSRKQGFQVMHQIRRDLAVGRVPAQSLVEGVCILLAGLLLITPGFVTDMVGFSLLFPPLRHKVYGALRETISFSVRNGKTGGFYTSFQEAGDNSHKDPNPMRGDGEVKSSWRVLSTQDGDSVGSKS